MRTLTLYPPLFSSTPPRKSLIYPLVPISPSPRPSNNTPSSVGDVLSSAGAPGLSFQLPRQSNLANDPLVVLMPSDAPHVPRAKRDFQVPDILHPTPMFIAFSIIPIVLLVGALVTFVVIWVRQRRNGQLKKLYLTEHPMIYPRRPVPKSLASNEDLEDAVQTLAYERFRSEQVSSSTPDEKEGSMLRIAESRMRRRELRDEEDGRTVVPGGPREIQPRRPHRHGVSASSYPDSGNQFDMSDCTQRPRSYAPEPRNLTASYFPPVLPPLDLSSDAAREDIHGAGAAIARSEGLGYASPIQESRHSDGADLDDYGHGIRLVESPIAMQSRMSSMLMPMGMSPPPPSVTKLSERLHLRRRSESRSGSPSSRGGEVPTVLRAKTQYIEQEKVEEADAKDPR